MLRTRIDGVERNGNENDYGNEQVNELKEGELMKVMLVILRDAKRYWEKVEEKYYSKHSREERMEDRCAFYTTSQ